MLNDFSFYFTVFRRFLFFLFFLSIATSFIYSIVFMLLLLLMVFGRKVSINAALFVCGIVFEWLDKREENRRWFSFIFIGLLCLIALRDANSKKKTALFQTHWKKTLFIRHLLHLNLMSDDDISIHIVIKWIAILCMPKHQDIYLFDYGWKARNDGHSHHHHLSMCYTKRKKTKAKSIYLILFVWMNKDRKKASG